MFINKKKYLYFSYKAPRGNSWNYERFKKVGIPKVMTQPTERLDLNRSPFVDFIIFDKSFEKRELDTIIFPDEIPFNRKKAKETSSNEDEIDLRPSFTPSNFISPLDIIHELPSTTKMPKRVPTMPMSNVALSSHCNATLTRLRLDLNVNAFAATGKYTYPNGTTITYAKCEVVVVTHPHLVT
jgi:hypothetical protein